MGKKLQKIQRFGSRVAATIIAPLLLVVVLTAPASAGFWEDLFGVRTERPSSQAASAPAAPSRVALHSHREKKRRIAHEPPRRLVHQAQRRNVLRAGGRRALAAMAHHLKSDKPVATDDPREIANPVQPCCDTASDAINRAVKDATLRPGDVVAGEDGLRVFVGDTTAGAGRSTEAFVPIHEARKIDGKLRSRLMAYAPQVPFHAPQVPLPLHPSTAGPSGRKSEGGGGAASLASAPAVPDTREKVITDFRGRTLRFVGGYMPPQYDAPKAPSHWLIP